MAKKFIKTTLLALIFAIPGYANADTPPLLVISIFPPTANAIAENATSDKTAVPKPWATFNLYITADGHSKMQSIDYKSAFTNASIPFKEIRNGSYAVRVYGVHLATVTGQNLNDYGEGILHIAIAAAFAGKINPNIDVLLKRMGPKNRFVVIHDAQAISQVNLTLNEDPMQTNIVSVFLSPPNIAQISFTAYGCDADFSMGETENFELAEHFTSMKCSRSPMQPSEDRQSEDQTDLN